MQKCYNCGKEVDDNVLICPDCGALVKRYGKPVPVEPDSYHQQPQPDAYPGAYEAPAQPGPRERVWLDAAGKPHFKGALCFWLIVCAVFAGYLLFGFGCMLLIYHAQGFFLDALAAFPEFSDLTDVLNLMLESIGTYYASMWQCRSCLPSSFSASSGFWSRSAGWHFISRSAPACC